MRVGFLLFVGFFLWTIAFAQEKNPFELTQSKSNPTMQVVKTTDTSSLGQTKSLPDSTNPFEVVNRKKEQVVADSNKSGQGKLIPAELRIRKLVTTQAHKKTQIFILLPC